MRQGSTLALVSLWLGTVGWAGPSAFAGGWGLPNESRGARVAPLLLLSRPDVRDDLKLTPDQAVEADRAIADFHRQAVGLKGRTDASAKAERRVVDERQWMWIELHLNDDQRDRLGQLDLRWEGPAAMHTRPAVAEALSLSPDQKAAIGRAVADRTTERAKDPIAAEKRFDHKVIAFLDEGQKQRWDRMLGRPFAPKVLAASSEREPGR